MHLHSNPSTTENQPSAPQGAALGMAALEYARAGFRIFPCLPGKKEPAGRWKDIATTDEATIKRWWHERPDANIGLPMALNGLVAVDIDTSRGADLGAIPAGWWQSVVAQSGAAPTEDGKYSFHILFNAKEGAKYLGKLADHVDIKHDGYIVAAPSVHPSGNRYEWIRAPYDHEPLAAPAELEARKAQPLAVVGGSERLETLCGAEIAEIKRWMEATPADDYELWTKVGMALRGIAGGFELWHAWSQQSEKYPGPDECRKKWQTFKPAAPGGDGISYRSLRLLLTGETTPPAPVKKRGRPKGAGSKPKTPQAKASLMAQLSAALEKLPDLGADPSTWTTFGAAIYADLGQDGKALFLEWSKHSEHTEQEIDEKWRSFAEETEQNISTAVILNEARKAGNGTIGDYPYEIGDDGFYYIKETKQGTQIIRLSNFTARIVAELAEDDGEHSTLGAYLIDGQAGGVNLGEIKVPCADFQALSWIETMWRSRATVMAGREVKDHLRAAIKLANTPTKIPVYKHSGWRKVDDRWLYLHAGGAIDGDGQVDDIRCDFDGELKRATLPEPPEGDDLLRCINASYYTRDILHDPSYGLLVMLAPYAAVLDEMMGMDFGIWMVGPPRSKKSAVTAIIQGHFGTGFARDRWMASWTSTDNALESAAHKAKDMPFVIDDYRPEQSRFDDLAQQKKADRIFRGKHNHAGRERMRADMTARPTYTPRGLPISSAEALPQSQSLRQRLIALEFDRSSVHVPSLSQSQADLDDGMLSGAMAGFIRLLAPKVEGYKGKLKDAKRRVRDYIRAQGINDRSADQAAYLVVTAMVFYKFADDAGLIDTMNDRWPEHFTVQDVLDRGGWHSYSTEVNKAIPLIIDLFRRQESVDAEADPVQRFLSTLANAMESGAAYVSTDLDGKVAPSRDYGRYGWKDYTLLEGDSRRAMVVPKDASSQHIGFIKNGALWLMPDAAFSLVQQILSKQGEPLVIGKARLYKHLKDNGLLLRSDGSRPSTVEPFATQDRVENKRVIAVKLSAFYMDDDIE